MPAGIALLFAVLLVAAAKAEATPRVVRVDVPTAASRDLLISLGLDLAGHGAPGTLDVVAHDAQDVQRLANAGLRFGPLPPSPPATPATDVAVPSGRTSYRRLHDYAADMRLLAARHPETVRLIESPVRSLEGRVIEGLEVARDVGARDGRPALLLLGLHHGREWPSGELPLEFAFHLARRHAAGDARVSDLLRRARVIVVPVVNPDGFHVSREAAGGDFALKRRNCRLIDFAFPPPGACGREENRHSGVDLNRNYDGFWGGPGSSADPESDVYRGAAPFSEPETLAVRQLVAKRQVVTLLATHTYGDLVLRPPGLASGPEPADEPLYRQLGDAMAAASGYASRRGYELYETTGTTEDWSHFATGGLGYTIEIGEGAGTAPFHPPFPIGVGAEWPGLREAFMLALESTADARRHGVLAGRGPAGAVVRARSTGGEPLDSTMIVPASGRFELHVNPSTRPLAAAAGRTEAWRVTCERPEGSPVATRDVAVGRGERVGLGEFCGARPALVLEVAAGRVTARGLRVPRGLRVRGRCSAPCTLSARLVRRGRVLARDRRRSEGVLRLRATRPVRPGPATLRVAATGRDGRRATFRRRLFLKRV